MKNKLWDKGLYSEGLRRTRTITVVCCVIAFLSVCFTSAIAMNGLRNYNIDEYGTMMSKVNYDGCDFAWFSVAVFLVCAPIMTLKTFSFLNSRSASDYWHAIPHTRPCLFFSFLTSMLTQYVLILAVTGFTSWISFLICSARIRLIPGTLIMFLIGSFAGALLVTAVFLISMSRTGTPLSNIVIGGIILFTPRLLITCIARVIMLTVDSTVNDMKIFPLSEPRYNIPFGILATFDDGTVTAVSSIIYTAVLALIYFAIALRLFMTRKSEAAGVSATSSRIQNLSRIAVGCSVSFIVTVFLVGSIVSGDDYYLPFVIFYTISVILYFLYELITTKRAKNLVKALPGLGIVIALNLILGFTVYGIWRFEDNFGKDAGTVSSVSIESDTNGETLRLMDYIFDEFCKEKITDRNIIKTVTEALSSEEEYSNEKHRNRVCVTLRTSLASRKRYVWITDEQLSGMIDTLKNSEEYRSLLNVPVLPEPDKEPECNVRLSVSYYRRYDYNEMITTLTAAQFKEVFDVLSEEVGKLGTDDWIKLNAENTDNSLKVMLSYHVKNGYLNDYGTKRTLRVTVHVSEALTPRTYETFFRFAAENGMYSYDNVVKKIEEAATWDDPSYYDSNYVQISYVNGEEVDDVYPLYFSLYGNDTKTAKDLAGFVRALKNTEVQENEKAYVVISVTDPKGKTYFTVIKTSVEDKNELNDLMNGIGSEDPAEVKKY